MGLFEIIIASVIMNGSNPIGMKGCERFEENGFLRGTLLSAADADFCGHIYPTV
jgi:hypothetical protein